MNFRIIIPLMALLLSIRSYAQESNRYTPEIHGTLRAKYEYEPPVGKGRFEIRNARLSIEGMIIPMLRYKAEIDLSDQGSIRMLDAYLRINPFKPLKLTCGQMRVPFSVDAHRSPHMQYFANRSFIAKQAGNVRDVGFAASWQFNGDLPTVLSGGIFNGSGLTNQKNFWTSNYNFSFKVQTIIANHFNISASCQKANAADTKVMMYDAGVFWEDTKWHIEAEYLHKRYAHGVFVPVDAADFFVAYKMPLTKTFTAISFLGRYDYMSDHSDGSVDENGLLAVSDPERHRITGGVTLHLGKNSLQADLRLNYEQYFYSGNVVRPLSEQNKFVLELVARF